MTFVQDADWMKKIRNLAFLRGVFLSFGSELKDGRRHVSDCE